jgi:hypothetical protein
MHVYNVIREPISQAHERQVVNHVQQERIKKIPKQVVAIHVQLVTQVVQERRVVVI